MISKFVYLILGTLGLIYLSGCNNAYVSNLSTNYDTEIDSLKISFKLNGSNSKRYNVKMAIVNNLNRKEVLLSSKSILPSPNYLKPKNYTFSIKAEQFDFSKNIYSIKLLPTIARKISDVKLEQAPKDYKYKIITNLGLLRYGQAGPNYEDFSIYYKPSLTAGYFQKDYGFSIGYSRGTDYLSRNIFLTDRKIYNLGVHKKLYENIFLGLSLGISTLEYQGYKYDGLNQLYLATISKEIYNESGISLTYIKNKINLQLNFSGLSLGYTNYFKDQEIGKNLKFFVHPSINLGIGYNFGFKSI